MAFAGERVLSIMINKSTVPVSYVSIKDVRSVNYWAAPRQSPKSIALLHAWSTKGYKRFVRIWITCGAEAQTSVMAVIPEVGLYNTC